MAYFSRIRVAYRPKKMIVVTLFNDQTPPADVEMMYIKETVFGVRDGAPLMDRSHPCLAALAAAYTGACNCV